MENAKRVMTGAVAAVALAALVTNAQAASDTWKTGVSGDYSNPDNWAGGNVPNGAADVATVEGADSIVNFGASDNVTLADLDLAMSASGGTPVFNQAGGTLSVNRLRFGGGGASRNPTYNLSDGTLNIASAFTWGNGRNAHFNYSGGTVNYSGEGFVSIGIASEARGHINGSGDGVFNADQVTAWRLGTTGNGHGYLNLQDNAVFNANGTGTFYLGNNGGSGFITIADSAELNAPNMVLSVGQAGSGTGSLIMTGGKASFARIAVGGDNAASAVTGKIELNGGVLETGQIRRGASNVASDANNNYLKVNGGTIRVLTHAGNADFLPGDLYTEIGTNGLTIDTNGNDIGIFSDIVGVGGLTKVGLGTLTMTAPNSYTGGTTVSGGTLSLGASNVLDDTGALNLAGGTLNVGAATDLIGSLNLVDSTVSTIQFNTAGDTETRSVTFAGIGAGTGLLNVTNWDSGLDQFLFVNEADALSIAALTTFVDPSGMAGLVSAIVIPSGGAYEVVPAPEPTSLVTLGLGGLAMLARRRRA